MAIRTIQPSFAGGVVSPSLRSRVDLAKYGTSLADATNFFIHPQGGASNRAGMRWIASTKDSERLACLVPFNFSSGDSYMLEFGHLYIRFYRTRAQLLDGLSAYEVVTPYTENDVFALDANQSADVIYLSHPDYQQRTLTRNDSTDWTLALFQSDDGPFMLSNTDEASTITPSGLTGSITLTAIEDIFDADHVGALWRIIHEIESQIVSTTLSSATSTTSINCGGTWRLITHGTWTAKIKVEISTDNGSSWKAARSFSSANDFNVDTYGEIEEDSSLVRVTCYSYTSGDIVLDLSSDAFEQVGIVRITAVGGPTSATATVLATLGATVATFDWAEGAWSDFRGYPACSIFVQDRLAFANTYAEPQTEWLSKTAAYTSFVRSSPLVASDGITVNLTSRKINGVKRMIGLRDALLALTASSDWSTGPGDNGVLSWDSVRTSIEGYSGSANVAPCLVRNRAIIAQPMGTVIRDLAYDLTTGYTGEPINIMASHLFEGKQVVQMAYAQEPYSLVWVVLNDGTLLSCTYMKEQEVLAWTPHETDGLVESVATIPGDGYDEVWLIVNRNGQRYVEVMDPRLVSTDPADQFFVDSGLSLDNPKTITAASKADPVVITSVAHGFADGDVVDIKAVEGMTELNGQRYMVANKTADDFTLQTEDGDDIDGTDFTAYTSGGEVRKVVYEVEGLDHLEGRTVAILGNGNVYPRKVVTSGAVPLSPGASIVHVGLPYTATLTTLNIEVAQPDGTLQSRKVKIPEVTIRFLNSRGGRVGRDADNTDAILQRANENYGQPIELFTGEVRKTIGSTFKSGASITILQRDPLPMTVLAVIPVVSIGR